jgi:hypothetical protein
MLSQMVGVEGQAGRLFPESQVRGMVDVVRGCHSVVTDREISDLNEALCR